MTPHELDAHVASVKWIHMSHYEERLTKHSEGWGVPFGGFNSSCSTRFYGTTNCNPHSCNPHQVGYSCNAHQCNCTTQTRCKNLKNGFSSCDNYRSCSTCYDRCTRTEYDTCYQQCPVYRDWCSYDFYDWVGRGDRTLSGASASTMEWADLGPNDETHRTQKTAAYIVHFTTGGDVYDYAPDTAVDFQRFADGQTWTCEKRVVGFFKPIRLR